MRTTCQRPQTGSAEARRHGAAPRVRKDTFHQQDLVSIKHGLVGSIHASILVRTLDVRLPRPLVVVPSAGRPTAQAFVVLWSTPLSTARAPSSIGPAHPWWLSEQEPLRLMTDQSHERHPAPRSKTGYRINSEAYSPIGRDPSRAPILRLSSPTRRWRGGLDVEPDAAAQLVPFLPTTADTRWSAFAVPLLRHRKH